MTIWGCCPDCKRWFACPTWFDKAEPQPLCPVCLCEPRAIRNDDEAPEGAYDAPAVTGARDSRPHAAGDRGDRVWGRCPACRRWFSARGWFDDSSPVPICPHCRLLPNALREDPPAPSERVGGPGPG